MYDLDSLQFDSIESIKRVCRNLIENINSYEDVETLLTAGVMPKLLELRKEQIDVEVKRNLMLVISAVIRKARPKQILPFILGEDLLKLIINELGCGDLDSIDSVQMIKLLSQICVIAYKNSRSNYTQVLFMISEAKIYQILVQLFENTDNEDVKLAVLQLIGSLVSADRGSFSITCRTSVQEAGWVDLLINKYIKAPANAALVLEAVEILSNLLVGTYADPNEDVMNLVVPTCLQLLHASESLYSCNEQVIVRTIQLLVRISKSDDNLIQMVEMGLFAAIEQSLKTSTSWATQELAKALTDFCKSWQRLSFDQIKPVVVMMGDLLMFDDPVVVVEACSGLSTICTYFDDRIGEVIKLQQAGFVSRVVELLDHEAVSVRAMSIRLVGSILAGDADVTTLMLQGNLLPALAKFLDKNFEKGSRNDRIKECLWGLSNITAGTPEHVQAVVDSNILPKVLSIIEHSDDSCVSVQNEAIYVLNNMLDGPFEPIRYLVGIGCVTTFANLLGGSNSMRWNGVTKALEFFKNLLNRTESQIIDEFVSSGALTAIETIQLSEDSEVASKAAASLLDEHFGKYSVDVEGLQTALQEVESEEESGGGDGEQVVKKQRNL